MIGKLSGRIEYKGNDHAMLDVRGVGYVVHCSERTLTALPGPGDEASLYTELLAREDLLQLMGFTTRVEREWYRLLVTVQGVGAKAAMAILGVLGPEGTGRAIALGDWASVRTAPGVGPRIAQRVVNELKDKVPNVMALGGTTADGPTGSPAPSMSAVAPEEANSQADALSALGNLGYAPQEAAAAVVQAASEAPELDAGELIRAALKLLAPKGRENVGP